MINVFCDSRDLINEADVEALVVEPLVSALGYTPGHVRRKQSLQTLDIAKGRSREQYRPDYVLTDNNDRPAVVIEAKSPTESVDDYLYQVGGYAFRINQQYPADNPVRFAIVANGLQLAAWHWDEEEPVVRLNFDQFQYDDPLFIELKSLVGYTAIHVARATESVFEFRRPRIDELRKVLADAHNIIWKKEAHGPTDAFYEFAKLIFVKLREDQRLSQLVAAGNPLTPNDFPFSTRWLSEQVRVGASDNPLSETLFRRVKEDLERQIQQGDKKRIFDANETIQLTHETIIQVVSKLQHLDLHGIDEDLNGRMFEQFLNATVRGKELGQFFTPRSVVKHMCRSADLSVKGKSLPKILDGCCGSGGFLIDAMTVVVGNIERRSDLTSREKTELKQQLYRDCLFGIDKSRKIARIARLNMYLHGDGGSTIFTTDMLDKELKIQQGLETETRQEVSELRDKLLGERTKFQVVLTNPPFSMKYRSSEADEKRILHQYNIATSRSGSPSTSENSNVLFIERYSDCLDSDGELLTVIDNTVLNGTNSQRYRDYILNHFIVRQVIALPFNTFYRAQAGVQTSIMHLKRRERDDRQGPVFMAILNNVGHDDHQRETPERDNVPQLIDAFRGWRLDGVITDIFEPNSDAAESLGCPFQVFVVEPDALRNHRLDAFYYSPDLRCSMRDALDRSDLTTYNGRDLDIIRQLGQREVGQLGEHRFKYFEIGNVTSSGAIVSHQEGAIGDLPTRARLRVRANDVLFARNISSRGTCVIVPEEFDGQLASNGFAQIRPEDEEQALLFWSLFTSEFFRKQVYYLSSTAVQPMITNDTFKNEFVLPVPRDPSVRRSMIENASEVRDLQHQTWTAVEKVRSSANLIFGT